MLHFHRLHRERDIAMQIDQTNLSIIRQLRDGRKSYKTIADKLGTFPRTPCARACSA